MEIEEVTEVTDELVKAFERLVPQLSPTAEAPTFAHLGAVVSSGGCTLLIARGDPPEAPIVGALTLTWSPIPTGLRASIEDVVVDQAARGRGVGDALLREALARAKALGATKVDLTSNPRREAANRLYQRAGFQLRETNAYRYPLDGGHSAREA